MGELFFDFSLFQFLPLPVIASMLLGGGLLEGWGACSPSGTAHHPITRPL